MPSFAVIGGGFSGINAVVQIKKRYPHAKIVLFEQGSQLGGCWYWNKYPGCACDVPSHLYSLSYELNPCKHSDWTDHYPSGESIQKYLDHVAAKHRIYEITTYVQQLEWLDNSNQWKLVSHAVVNPQLSPKTESDSFKTNVDYFDYGMSLFKGDVIHTARWPVGFNPKGKRIAVIGTGASGVQVIPELQKVAKSLTVFQRHASWVDKKVEYKYSSMAKWIFKYIPGAMTLWRLFIFFGQEFGYLAFLRTNLLGRIIHSVVTNDMKRNIQKSVKDTLKQKLLTPKYLAGARRITPSNHYLKAMASTNTTLISGDPISHITETTIVTEGGISATVDVIVLATGFELLDVFSNFQVTGRSSSRDAATETSLRSAFSPIPKAYMGTLVPGLPNFFLSLGPNLGFGHQSVLIPIELQMEYTMKLIQASRKAGLSRIEVRKEAGERWNLFLKAGFERTVWKTDTSSYYFSGKGENFTIWPYSSLYMLWIFGKQPLLSDFVAC
ncbi:hypothetical protein BDR26DRAFT_876210 [Obelidium mucronatum]|nr:hypothetical protein BDR26DRAFT_876210 [Obelidium mucronatum]